MHINELPGELISKIFLLGRRLSKLSAHQNNFFRLLRRRDELDSAFRAVKLPRDWQYELGFLINISHVSQEWRNIALSTAMLWTTVIFITTEHPIRRLRRLDRANAWIARSKSCDLDIYIHSPEYVMNSEVDMSFNEILEICIPELYRWRKFVFSTHAGYQIENVIQDRLFRHGPAPRLKTIKLYDCDGNFTKYPDNGFTEASIFSQPSTNLSKVTLIGVNLPWAESLSQPTRDLTYLELCWIEPFSWPKVGELLTILAVSPNLTTLILVVNDASLRVDDVSGSGDTLVMPVLTNMSLHSVDGIAYFSRLFEALDLPSLAWFEIRFEEASVSDLEEMISILKPALKNLHSVCIKECAWRLDPAFDAWLKSFYQSVPNLNQLRVHASWWDAMKSEHDMWFKDTLPKLQVFEIVVENSKLVQETQLRLFNFGEEVRKQLGFSKITATVI